MSNSIKQADLVARALGVLPDEERARVDRALEADERLRLEFEEIAGHLLQYDALSDLPPPPPFARIAERMEVDETPDLRVLKLANGAAPARGRLIAAVAAAAVLVCAVLIFHTPREGRVAPTPAITRGPGMELALRRHGPELYCERTAEAQLGKRARIVMDGRSRMVVDSEHAVDLLAGRAWFEVKPDEREEFTVTTRFGRVRVLGTTFEVDVRGEELRVVVAEGRVRAGGLLVEAGATLAAGEVKAAATPAGAWFRMPTLSLGTRGDAPTARDAPIELSLVLTNPGNVAMRLEGPGSSRTPVWLRFETAGGELLQELPVLASNVVSGLELLEPRGSVVLAAGSSTVLAVRILPPFASPGAYRCTALYRPEGQAPVLSSPLELEVR